MNRSQVDYAAIYWTFWIAGSLLIVLSWVNVVSNLIGWIGFILATVATVFSLFIQAVVKRQPEQTTTAREDVTEPIDVQFTDNMLQVSLADGRVISAPLEWYPKLRDASEEDRVDYELEGNGIYWSKIDVDVSVFDLLDGVPPQSYEE